ncbi:peptidase S8/S53 domain-containing protein [Dichotomocladium elegans]|nr:peptidase S8/S53 domain-containing protein [Dichotomocladium elegans]
MTVGILLLLFFTIFLVNSSCGNIIPDAFIVEYVDQHQDAPILSSLKGEPSNAYQIRQKYASPLFHGLSIRLLSPLSKRDGKAKTMTPAIPGQLAEQQQLEGEEEQPHHPLIMQLMEHPGVRKVYPVHEVPRIRWMHEGNLHNTLPYDLGLTQIENLQNDLKLTGSGITIGILDSGVDYTHPALGGGFGEGFKIKIGKNLVDPKVDDEDVGSHRSVNDPYDPCIGDDAGHGTHVAGIISGMDPSKNFLGVAPNVTLGSWRVFSCKGSAAEDAVIKAMELAYRAGCDVINLSLSVQTAWPENPMAVVADRLTEKGVIVVSVAGNEGEHGVFTQTSPGSGTRTLAVGSIDNTFLMSKAFSVNIFPKERFIYALSTSTTAMVNGTLLIPVDKANNISLGCDDDSLPNANNQILLIRRGTCDFDTKLKNAERMGAIGVMFVDMDGETENSIVRSKTSNDTIPSVGITKGLAEDLLSHRSEAITVTFPLQDEELRPATSKGKVISVFSGVGPTNELGLKPDIASIGSNVYSTLPSHINHGWGLRSGTSMAAPQVTGIVALMLEYYRRQNISVTPSMITEVIQNHAQPVLLDDGRPENPLRQGAGFIQPLDAIQKVVRVSPASISFNDTANLIRTHTLHISNNGHEPVTFNMEHKPSPAMLPFDGSSYKAAEPSGTESTYATLSFSISTIRLAPGQTTAVNVTINLPQNVQPHYQMYGGFISLLRNGFEYASVPYFGVYGSMSDLPIFDTGFPYLASSKNYSVMYEANDRFIFNATAHKEYPVIVSRLVTATAHVLIDVLDTSGIVVGAVFGSPFNYWDRNTLDPNFYVHPVIWNGQVVDPAKLHVSAAGDPDEPPKMVKAGTYRIRLRALKLLANPDLPQSWEEWVSLPIHVVF